VSAAPAEAPRFRSLIPERGELLTAAEVLSDWRGPEGDASRLALNMVASVDGRIAVDGHSTGLSGPADRALFHALRCRADAVMAGAGTIRSERYGPIIRDTRRREMRLARELPEQPLAVIVSRSLDLDPTTPLLADAESHVVVLTPSPGELPACAAKVDYVRAASLSAGLAELRAEYGVRLVLCEGGPFLNAALAQESLIDELFLAIAPMLVGDTVDGAALLRGASPRRPLALELRMLLEHESQLYAHYVSRS
jgi:riboflavin biosynthesis pyrimidine reductase